MAPTQAPKPSFLPVTGILPAENYRSAVSYPMHEDTLVSFSFLYLQHAVALNV